MIISLEKSVSIFSLVRGLTTVMGPRSFVVGPWSFVAENLESLGDWC